MITKKEANGFSICPVPLSFLQVLSKYVFISYFLHSFIVCLFSLGYNLHGSSILVGLVNQGIFTAGVQLKSFE
jgi:hypothetical protein